MKKLKSVSCMLLAVLLCIALFHVDTLAGSSKKVKLSKSTATVTVGKTTTLKAKYNGKSVKATKVKWTSSKKAVATVSSKGKVKAKKAGNTVIKATYRKNGKSYTAQCKVTVKAKTAGHSHEWVKVVDKPAWDEETQVAITELRLANHRYLKDGTDTTGWTREQYGEWETQHCPRGCGGANVPDPTVCVFEAVEYSADTYVVVGYRTETVHWEEVSHLECKVCGVTKD